MRSDSNNLSEDLKIIGVSDKTFLEAIFKDIFIIVRRHELVDQASLI